MMKKLMYLMSALLLLSCSHDAEYDATGVFEATEIALSSDQSGIIVSFVAQEGDVLSAGSEVALLDTVLLSLQREQLVSQQSGILRSRPDTERQVAELRRRIEHQAREVERVDKMLAGGAATQKQYDDQKSQLDVLQSQLSALLTTLGKQSGTASDNAAAIEAQIRQVEERIRRCSVKSPISGTVLVKYQQQGEMAVAGKPLCKIADLDNMHLRCYFTSDQLADVKVGQQVKVIADFGGDSQREYEGTISWISDESEFTPKGIQTRDSRANLVYAAKVAVKNDGSIKIGTYGEVKL